MASKLEDLLLEQLGGRGLVLNLPMIFLIVKLFLSNKEQIYVNEMLKPCITRIYILTCTTQPINTSSTASSGSLILDNESLIARAPSLGAGISFREPRCQRNNTRKV